MRADVVVDAENIGLLVCEAQRIEPVDALFVTDETHQATLQRQLADTEQLIARAMADFQQRHGTAMPDDNVWLAQRRAEQAALTQLLSIMDTRPGRAIQGGGCGVSSGPVPITLDTRRPRRGQR